MVAQLQHSLLILPVPDLEKTAAYYEQVLKFKAVKYLQSTQPHICLYKDNVEIVLTKSKLSQITPNRIMHGYGYDGYFTGQNIDQFYNEFIANGAKIVKPLAITDYGNQEFVIEDIDGRWVCIGVKQQ